MLPSVRLENNCADDDVLECDDDGSELHSLLASSTACIDKVVVHSDNKHAAVKSLTKFFFSRRQRHGTPFENSSNDSIQWTWSSLNSLSTIQQRLHALPMFRKFTLLFVLKLFAIIITFHVCLFCLAAFTVWLFASLTISYYSPTPFALLLVQKYDAAAALRRRDFVVDITVQDVVPLEADAYFCASYDLSTIINRNYSTGNAEEGLYIVAFESINPNGAAHHILLYLCEHDGGGSTNRDPSAVRATTWSCGSGAHHHHHHHHQLHAKTAPPPPTTVNTSSSLHHRAYTQAAACSGTHKQTLFAWAHRGGPLQLPPNTGFRIDPNDSQQQNFLVVQVHYNDRFQQLAVNRRNLTDSSGIRVRLQKLPHRTTRPIGIWLFAAGGILMPHTPRVAFEMACAVPAEIQQIIPIAYRTHTHEHGVLVEAYRVRRRPQQNNSSSEEDEWTLIGSRDPQEPQVFVEIQQAEKHSALQQGDSVAARCIMSNNSSRMILTASGMHDEMCNFYLMYYTTSSTLIEQSASTCFTAMAPFITWQSSGLKVPLRLQIQQEASITEEQLPNMLGALLVNL